ncbi:thermonuclease family protein [Chelatococcus asaccharovorans]|uniref:Endonuclease YncB(Thermonuclease family) n=1 Tax=Chelatococcus asaccharovorans TaxID=28210 RepID=A0A2V3TS47_9HYPH|nr:thermonuclease family protein [Chelatococcus asaccharovorans]PXW51592.1 endonuclease YncB(thermonuclease family) [Chelatococcus asaccharovorans]
MAYSPSELSELETRIESAMRTGHHLSAWELKFLANIQARFRKFGPETRLSEKQVRKLEEIMGALPTGSTNIRYLSRPPRRRHRHLLGGVLAREARWLTRRFLRDLSLVAAIMVIASAFVAFQKLPSLDFSSPFSFAPSNALGPMETPQFSVVDGDTIRISGEAKGMRLVGFNTPETTNARCAQERELGRRATERLSELVTSGKVTIERVACSCRPGTEGTEACNYGRSCGTLRVDGRDVGPILIAEGLAVPFRCGATSCPPTPRPWCG